VSGSAVAGPIRVVVFSSGPAMTHDARRFLCRLEDEPEIDFLGAICQAESTSAVGVARDLWRRRGLLAPALFLQWISRGAARLVRAPKAELTLRKRLALLGDRIHYVPDIHAEEVIRRLTRLEPDLGLVYGGPILRESVFEAPKLGSLGIHHGKVPAYRGNKTTFWAMYNGEETAGVTIQKIGAGLDTGEIVAEGEVPIGWRSRRAVWRDLEELGLDLYVRAVLDMKHGTAELRPQTGPKAPLYRNPRLADLLRFHWRRLGRRMGLRS